MAGMPKQIIIKRQNILLLPQTKHYNSNEIKLEINQQSQHIQVNSDKHGTSNNKKRLVFQNISTTPLNTITPIKKKHFKDMDDSSSQYACFIPKESSNIRNVHQSFVITDLKATSSAGNAYATLSGIKNNDEDSDSLNITLAESTSSVDLLKAEDNYDEEPTEYEEEYLEDLLEDPALDSVTELSEHMFNGSSIAATYEQPCVVEFNDIETNSDGTMCETVLVTETDEDFECHLCNLVFVDQESKDLHAAQEHDFYYECTQCEHRTPSPEAARAHFRDAHQTALAEPDVEQHVECDDEDRVATEALLMQVATAADDGLGEPVDCEYCLKTFYNRKTYNSHVKRHKKKQAEACAALSSDDPAALHCDECGVRFASPAEWTKHVLNARRHKDKKRVIMNGCKHCGLTFRSPNDLRVHIADEHPAVRQRASTWTEPQPCAICNELMANSHAYWAHFRRAHPNDEYPLRTRMNHECRHCGKAFRCKAILKVHMNTHTGAKPFQCGECDKKFFTTLSLRYHQITHSESRPFACETCGRAFKFKAAMTRHQLVHTGERPFVCGVCGQGFTTMHWTQLHVRKVHNKEDIPYKPRIRKRSKRNATD